MEPVPTGATVSTVLLRMPYFLIPSRISSGSEPTNLLREYPSHS